MQKVLPSNPHDKIGRNDLCFCGSGKKYKKCHLIAENEQTPESLTRARAHALDGRLVREILRFAHKRFGDEWQEATEPILEEIEESDGMMMHILVPWMGYHLRIQDKPVVDWYLNERGHRLSSEERAWLEAQQLSWLSVWEVQSIDKGRSMVLKDMLSGETREVHEKSGTETLVVYYMILGRVVDFQGISVMCGFYPRPLPPDQGQKVVDLCRSYFHVRTKPVRKERLYDEDAGEWMLGMWSLMVDALDARSSRMPQLQNTDGHVLLLTNDHFTFEPSLRQNLEERLGAIKGVERNQDGSCDTEFVFTVEGNAVNPGWENTIVGRAVMGKGTLRLEANSIERADALRTQVEEACSASITHRMRDHSDVAALMNQSDEDKTQISHAKKVHTSEEQQIVIDFKRRHYAGWIDHPLPALDDLTPREASQSARYKKRLEVLLKDMYTRESRLPEGERYNISELAQLLSVNI